MSICLVAEKPSVARDIAATLGQPEKHEGYLSVGDYLITWAFGHLVTLADPQIYEASWEKWSFSTLPMMPDVFQLTPTPKGKAQLKIVHSLMKEADSIIAATDGDREGELIFRYIYRLSGSRKPVQRLWLSENTPSAIQRAMASMKPLSAYENLGNAAEARSQADWLVGLNATRAYTLRHGVPGQGALSVGRVQTPTLALIAARDNEIAGFKPVPYWQAAVTFRAVEGDYIGLWLTKDSDRIAEKAQAQNVAGLVPSGTPGTIQSVERKRVTVQPPLLFSLNDLQKEANRRFGLTAQQTLDTAQSLYEKHLTSYPRTDAKYITADVAQTIHDRLHGLSSSFGQFIQMLPAPLNTARIIDDKKVSEAGHHAIIPTGHAASGLNESEAQVFDLIVRRLFSALMPAGEDERTTILTQANGQTFRTKGTAIVSEGWRAVVKGLADGEKDSSDEDSGPIPAGLRNGETVAVAKVDVLEKATKAAARLNDASLLALMEKHGLGTPATRARIVEVLLLRGYVTRQKKALLSTEKGQALLKVLPAAIQSPEMTGTWEAQLEAIANGTGSVVDFMAGIRAYTQELVADAQGQASQAIGTDLGPCPSCGKGRIVPGKKAYGCSRWREGCKFTVWKEIAGKKLTENQVKVLLSGKVTSEIKGFTSKAGKPFSAKLQLIDGRVQFVFAAKKRGA